MIVLKPYYHLYLCEHLYCTYMTFKKSLFIKNYDLNLKNWLGCSPLTQSSASRGTSFGLLATPKQMKETLSLQLDLPYPPFSTFWGDATWPFFRGFCPSQSQLD